MKTDHYFRQLDQDFERREAVRSRPPRELINGTWMRRCARCGELDSELDKAFECCGTCWSVMTS